MSRLIVKNLPNGITQQKLLSTFSEKGVVTDVQLKYAKDGTFRRFAFVGFKNEENAKNALDFFNNTCLGTNKIQIEICADLGSDNKSRAWSKYSKDSTAYKKLHPEAQKESENEKKKIKKPEKDKNGIEDPRVKELLEKYKDDPLFSEFMDVRMGKSAVWSNDALGGDGDGPAVNEETLEQLQKSVKNSIPDKELATAKISDFEYLKRKMVKNSGEDEKESSDKEEVEDDDEMDVKEEKQVFFTVILRGLPYKAKKKDVKVFLQPLKPKSIRVPTKVKSIAYVGFATESDQKKALLKNRSFMQNKRIFVQIYEDCSKVNLNKSGSNDENPWKEKEDSLKHEETIAESGRIFVRNLSYSVTEEEIQALFSKYGELSEVILPVDQNTRKIKGFSLVTFLFPEHAVKAYSELDGTSFQGRMLHLLPAKSKPSIDELLEQEGLDYKQKKALLQKKMATSRHNWNTLFLGQNAVTDLIAENYNTTKEKVLDDSGKGSLAVRVALGETQLVAETRKFLIESGVQLDEFNKPTSKRSNKLIMVKNLPAKTSGAEIRELFEPYGLLGRVILPPCGVTALVEFVESSEAKRAFLKLAYTKFKNLPLYLEWAPAESLAEPSSTPAVEKTEEVNHAAEKEDDRVPEPDSTLYIKNLSFNTTENSLREHFKKLGSIATVMIATKPDVKNKGERLSQGYGFIQFFTKKAADAALKTLQQSKLDGHTIELKRSHRTLQAEYNPRKDANQAKQTGTKIIVRNIPFQATKDEISELFKVFGEIKAIRLPKKMVGTGPHRGFAFIDFHTKTDAKKAMEALCQSTHLYGRRLVLEWAAADEEDVDVLRKRTAEHFASGGPAVKTNKKSVFDMKSSKREDNEDSD